MSEHPRSSLDYLAPQRPVRSDFARRQRGLPYAARRFITLGVLLVIMAAGAVWGWGYMSPSTPEEIPTVKAEGPVKQRPDQPGGVEIPNQDMQVYHAIDSEAPGREKAVVEHMLPPPETPNIKESETPGGAAFFHDANQQDAERKIEDIKPPEPVGAPSDPLLDTPSIPIPTTVMTPHAAKPVEPAVAAQTVPVQARVDSQATVPAQTVVAPQTPAPAATASPLPAAVPAPVPAAAAAQAPVPVPAPAPVAVASPPAASVAAPAPAPAPAPQASVKDGTVIQLAATQDAHAAENLVQALQKKYGKVLGTAHLHAVRANLGAKGVFYRIQSQPLSPSAATTICAAIKQQNAGCLLVRP